MNPSSSVQFFDAQFERQVRLGELELNPFEVAALPFVRGRVLDFGCGLGNLSVAAAERGCSVVALDASHAAIEHIRQVASARALPIEASEADLRAYPIVEDYDTIVSIGLLMFFDCSTALHRLSDLQARVRSGGTAIVNVLVKGTTYFDMFDPHAYCLFAPDELQERFSGWTTLYSKFEEFSAPGGRIKSFVTLAAQKPAANPAVA